MDQAASPSPSSLGLHRKQQLGHGQLRLANEAALRKGTYSSLNVYFSPTSAAASRDLQLPHQRRPGSSTYNQDGCDVLAGSVPGGSVDELRPGRHGDA
ncbi:hypothetical protein G7Y79_00121g101950 [Physcia stellaris]|nr:hypothetical protein G7Y79_00121g101950 [Physcia stellaris]